MQHLKQAFACLFLLLATSTNASPVKLQAIGGVFEIDPESGRLAVESPKGHLLTISNGQSGPIVISDLQTSAAGISWTIPAQHLRISVSTRRDTLIWSVSAETAGTSFTWPSQPLSQMDFLIWPRREGCFIPLDDPVWKEELLSEQWNTLEGICMPFWGVRSQNGILSCVASSQFHNAIKFSETTSNALSLLFSHSFVDGEARTFEFNFRFVSNPQASVLTPAFDYRKQLIDSGQFLTLKQKMKTVPAIERLFGAPNVYLWGGGLLTRFDFARHGANGLSKALLGALDSPSTSPAGHIARLIKKSDWSSIRELADSPYELRYAQSALADALSRVVSQAGFNDPSIWPNGPAISDSSTTSEMTDPLRRNCFLLHETFPAFLKPVEEWGGGFSQGMLDGLKAAGLDKLRIAIDDWTKLAGHREFAEKAIQMGYLIGPYDSYHSIHDPKTSGTDATWPTAQFDQKLFESGPIEKRDGARRGGFKRKGYLLSPIAARPYVEKRVGENSRLAPFNFYFFDCDGFGQLYDDYSPLHPATEQSDGMARSARMEWVGRKFDAVIGTEGGSAYAVNAVANLEGAFVDSFGWGDKDMSDKNSPYYPGGFYPPEEPAAFFKGVPAKPKYLHLFFEPQYRLPLFEAVYHDAVVSTHHWSSASLKFSNAQTTCALSELLYQVPPMYHLNPDELAKRKSLIAKQYRFFSPIHRKTATMPMTGFEWLTPDGTVQKTEFSEGSCRIELIANFSANDWTRNGITIPPASISFMENERKPSLYTP